MISSLILVSIFTTPIFAFLFFIFVRYQKKHNLNLFEALNAIFRVQEIITVLFCCCRICKRKHVYKPAGSKDKED